jgi:hypothetical protein
MTTSNPAAGSAVVALAHLGGVETLRADTALGSAVPVPAPAAPAPAPTPAPVAARAKADDPDAKKARRKAKAKKRDDDDNGDDDPNEDEDSDADEDDDEDMSASSVTGRARRRERRRCAAIFDAAGSLNVVGARRLAAHYAFETRLPRKAAIASLRVAAESLPARPAATATAAPRRTLDERIAAEGIAVVPPTDTPQRAEQPGDRILRARAKALGQKGAPS